MNPIRSFFRKRKSVDRDESFVALLRVAQEEPEVRQQLLSILALDSFSRKSLLRSLIEDMSLKRAPKPFVKAIANLLDDAIAEKALELIREEE